ncbi:MAG: hypothetical protein HJJLKODD_00815 [Phycisphaerae bacterium]|nr:hypothetical protein [Phycisphaerae bacterium]
MLASLAIWIANNVFHDYDWNFDIGVPGTIAIILFAPLNGASSLLCKGEHRLLLIQTVSYGSAVIVGLMLLWAGNIFFAAGLALVAYLLSVVVWSDLWNKCSKVGSAYPG